MLLSRFQAPVWTWLFFPFARVVFLVAEDVADVNFVPIVMHGGNQSSLVAADVEDGEFSHLVRVGGASRLISQNSRNDSCARFDTNAPAMMLRPGVFPQIRSGVSL